MDDPAILFVKPGAIKPRDKTELRKAGVTVVEIEDVRDVKLMRAKYEVPHSDILGAAVAALKASGYSEAKFGELMIAAIQAHLGKQP